MLILYSATLLNWFISFSSLCMCICVCILNHYLSFIAYFSLICILLLLGKSEDIFHFQLRGERNRKTQLLGWFQAHQVFWSLIECHTWCLIYKWHCQEIGQIRREVIAPELQNIAAEFFLTGGTRKEFSLQIPPFTNKKSETKKYYQFIQGNSPSFLALLLYWVFFFPTSSNLSQRTQE